MGQQVAARATRDALFLSHHDVATLPLAMAAAAALSLASIGGASGALARWAPARVLPLALGASALLLIAEWLLSMVSPAAAGIALYLHVAVFGATLLSAFWLLAGERFDPRSAKDAMARIGAAANAGAVLGGGLAWSVGRTLGVPAMLPVLALVTAIAWVGVRRLGAAAPGAVAEAETTPSSGLGVLKEMPYLRSVAAVVALGAFAEAVLDYVLGARAVERFGAGPRLMTFFSAFHTAVSVLAAGLLALAGGPALRRLGVAGTVALRPAAAAAAGLVAFVAPGLAGAVTARAAEALVRNSLFRSGYELLFIPIAPRHKRPVKAILDVGLDRIGTLAGSAAVFAAIAAGIAHALPLAVLAAGALTVLLAIRLHGGYVASLAANLRSGAVSLEGDGGIDMATRFTLLESRLDMDRETLLRAIHRTGDATRSQAIAVPAAPSGVPRVPASDHLVAAIEDLRSGDPDRVRLVLRGQIAPALVSHVVPLLARDELAGQAQRALRALSIRATGQLVDALLDPAHAVAIRRRLPPVIGTAGTQRAADGLLLGLRDEVVEVRARCGRALEAVRASHPGIAIPRETVLAAAKRELGLAETDDRGLAHVFVLLGLAGDAEAIRVAAQAVRSDAPGVRGTALEYLDNVVAEPLRSALLRRLGEKAPSAPRPRPGAREDLLKSAAHLVRPEPASDES